MSLYPHVTLSLHLDGWTGRMTSTVQQENESRIMIIGEKTLGLFPLS